MTVNTKNTIKKIPQTLRKIRKSNKNKSKA